MDRLWAYLLKSLVKTLPQIKGYRELKNSEGQTCLTPGMSQDCTFFFYWCDRVSQNTQHLKLKKKSGASLISWQKHWYSQTNSRVLSKGTRQELATSLISFYWTFLSSITGFEGLQSFLDYDGLCVVHWVPVPELRVQYSGCSTVMGVLAQFTWLRCKKNWNEREEMERDRKTKSKKVDYVQQETKSLQSLRQLCKSQFCPDFFCPGFKFWMIFACNCHHASIFSLQATSEWKLSGQERWKLQPNSLQWDTKLTPCW